MLITIRSKRISIVLTGMLCTLIIVSSFSTQSVSSDYFEPYFTLVAKTNGGGTRPDHLNLLKQQLERININLDVVVLDWPTFVAELISYRNFDICYVGLSGSGKDPMFTNVYSENGSLNLFGYHTSMDWDEELGTGKNEWYMEQGNLIMPPNSQERVQHYWDWEQYMMDKICPLAPTFTPSDYMAYWHNLDGYNFTDGLLQSWGRMSWDGSHQGQVNTNEVIIADSPWSDLNPLFQDDAASISVSEAILDRLIWYDADLSVWPHLGTVSYLNDTTIEIVCREGIKWDDDPDGLFSNEDFNVEDVFFTLYLWGHISCDTYLTEWMDELEIIDEMTMRIHIDGDTSTPEKEPYAPGLPFLSTLIIPEHYLNQTQNEYNEIMPDITHPSWYTFATHPFGTGLFELTEFNQNYETLLTAREDCWWSNTSITSDPGLDWERRFGDFSGGLEQLRIKIVSSVIDRLTMLEHGSIDLTEVTDDRIK
ncbi:MAG: ABC transporter substrate-binding protein, partial [Candidatus Heimdallarchaeota archaeon]